MVGCKRRERCTHRIASYVSWTETGRLTTGKQIGNGDEVAAIGLHRVRRGFTCLPVIQELLEPLGDLLDGLRDGGYVAQVALDRLLTVRDVDAALDLCAPALDTTDASGTSGTAHR